MGTPHLVIESSVDGTVAHVRLVGELDMDASDEVNEALVALATTARPPSSSTLPASRSSTRQACGRCSRAVRPWATSTSPW